MFRTFMTAAVFAATSFAAQAATFDFSYFFYDGYDFRNLTGVIEGERDAFDSNRVFVDGITEAAVDGVSGAEIGYIASGYDYYTFEIFAGPAHVTFDGSDMALLACNSNPCTDGFAFHFVDDGYDPGYTFESGPTYGNAYSFFYASAWTLTQRIAEPDTPSEVPLPATGILLLAGLTGLTVARRRRA